MKAPLVAARVFNSKWDIYQTKLVKLIKQNTTETKFMNVKASTEHNIELTLPLKI